MIPSSWSYLIYISYIYLYICYIFCWQVAQVKQMAAEAQAQLKPCWQGESGQLLCRSLVRFFFPLTVSHVHSSVKMCCMCDLFASTLHLDATFCSDLAVRCGVEPLCAAGEGVAGVG